jgi:peptidoglycan hydrolase-like protein with peptidoglycan-binding domain
MTKLAYSDIATINIARKASKCGVALLVGATFLLSNLATEPVHAKGLGRGVAIGLGVFGLSAIMNEAGRSERYDDHDDDDNYQKRSYRKSGKSRSTRSRTSAPKVQFSQKVLEKQRLLNRAGYDAGMEDGIRGHQTIAAIKEFQRDNGDPETGRLTAVQIYSLHALAHGADKDVVSEPGITASVETVSDPVSTVVNQEQESYKPNFAVETAENETKIVASHENMRQTASEVEIDPSTLELEKALFSLQMIQSVPDGKIDDETVAAIKQYQSHLNDSPTGELTPEQRAHLILLVQAYFSFEKK